jgi:hypothetical protein
VELIGKFIQRLSFDFDKLLERKSKCVAREAIEILRNGGRFFI